MTADQWARVRPVVQHFRYVERASPDQVRAVLRQFGLRMSAGQAREIEEMHVHTQTLHAQGRER